jgi:glycosyltransferase 2 family protein
MNRDRISRLIYPTLGFLFFVFSLYILHHELERYNLADILSSLSLINKGQVFYAVCLTILEYLVISSYDLISFYQLKRYLPIQRILFTTFITYAISNTTGFTLLIGGGIRYRFYSFWGVATKDIAKITALGNLTFWLGVLTLGGINFISNPLQLPGSLNFDWNLSLFLCK